MGNLMGPEFQFRGMKRKHYWLMRESVRGVDPGPEARYPASLHPCQCNYCSQLGVHSVEERRGPNGGAGEQEGSSRKPGGAFCRCPGEGRGSRGGRGGAGGGKRSGEKREKGGKGAGGEAYTVCRGGRRLPSDCLEPRAGSVPYGCHSGRLPIPSCPVLTFANSGIVTALTSEVP